ncbi:MAG: fused MFS/spermidine synthase [Phycisphaerales bacterium]|jgi:spermidine synthase
MRKRNNEKEFDEDTAEGETITLRKRNINRLMLIYFASGVCSLIDEVVWVRLLKLILGNTVYASSIVVSTFMGGLALGAFIMSRYSDNIKNRLQLYALLETLITISALSLPWALKIIDKAYIWFYHSFDPTHRELLVVQIIVSGLILLIPSVLMGSTLPLLGRFITSLEKEAGRLVGKLYTLNTFGAAVGCFLAGFVLLRLFGVMGTLYVAAALNLFVAFGGWSLSKSSENKFEERSEEILLISTKPTLSKAPDGRLYVLALAFLLSGAISIGYELLWMRSIIHLLSGYTYVFSSVLTVYLLGNVIGAGIGSGLVKGLKCPAKGFAVTLYLLGICGVFYLPLLIIWTSKVLPDIEREVELANMIVPFSTYMVKPLVQSAFLFLLPSIIMGIGFPIALQAWTNHMHKIGRSTGMAYCANTIGAVMGGIVTGFILLPLLGLQITISLLGLAGIWIAGVIWLIFTRNSGYARRFGFLMAAALFTAIIVKMPSDLFDTIVKSNPMLPEQLELVAVREGASTTVSLYKDPSENTLYLYTSGQRVAGDTYFWRSDQKMLGHFGVLLNSKAKKVLSIGFGSGESTACMALHKLERADCVEIAREIVDLSSRFFRHINLGDRLSDEIGMIYMDAKNYIHLTNTKYDAIVNDSIHPKHFAENSSLYAKEYFEDAKERLDENGLFISWIPTHNVEPMSVLNSIIGTMMEVFPHVTIWYMTPDPAQYFLVVGSEQPQYFSPEHIESELSRDGVHESLSEININNNMDVLSCYIGDENDLRRSIKSFSINSDFQPFIEFTTDNKAAGCLAFQRFISRVKSDSVYEHIDWKGFSEGEKETWLSDYKQIHDASSYLLMSNGAVNLMDKLSCCIDGLAVLPENPALLDLRQRTEKEIFSFCSKLILTGRTEAALSYSRNVLKTYPKSAVAWMIRSLCLRDKDNIQKSLYAAAMATRLAPDNADVHFLLGSIMFDTGQVENAVTEYEEASRLSKQPRRFAIYNQAGILNTLARRRAVLIKQRVAEAASEGQLESTPQSRSEELTKNILQSKILSEATNGMMGLNKFNGP